MNAEPKTWSGRLARVLVTCGMAGLMTVAAKPVSLAAAESVAKRPRPAPVAKSAHTLRGKLARAGRAEVRFERETVDFLSGKPEVHGGTLALELPDRVMLHFTTTDERLALRGDGGEWLQPELDQMLVLSSDHLGAARLWWGFLLGQEEMIVERKLADRHYRMIVAIDGEFVDSATVWLNEARLPRRLAFHDDNGVDVNYVFKQWRFTKQRGREAFVLRAPKSFEVVRLP